jgi:hypothetical protein
VRPVGELAAGFVEPDLAAGAIVGAATAGVAGAAVAGATTAGVADAAVVVGAILAGATGANGAGCARLTAVGAEERIGCTEETIGASPCFSTIGSAATSSELAVFLGAAKFGAVAFFAEAFLAAAFFTGAAPSATFFGAVFFATLASDGCSSRTNPSRLARTRTRSACCSIIVDDCVLTPMPNLEHRPSVS